MRRHPSNGEIYVLDLVNDGALTTTGGQHRRPWLGLGRARERQRRITINAAGMMKDQYHRGGVDGTAHRNTTASSSIRLHLNVRDSVIRI